jgi:F420H(2)-dependent biliverdin reductase
VSLDPRHLPDEVLDFVRERHLATLTTLRANGSPHVVPVGFTWSAERGVVRVITFAPSIKARNATRGGRASVCQVDGGRWLTFEGPVQVTDDGPGGRGRRRLRAALPATQGAQ